MSFEDYSEIKAVNWSSLKLLEESKGGSPRLYKRSQLLPDHSTPAKRIGSATHCTVLEPAEFDARYYVSTVKMPEGWEEIYQALVSGAFDTTYAVCSGPKVRRGKVWDAFFSDHGADPRPILLDREVERVVEFGAGIGTRTILTVNEYETIQAAGEAIRERPEIMAIVNQARKEQTVEWTDPVTGLACKARLDLLAPSWGADLKTTSSPLIYWPRECDKYLCHGQFAFYDWGSVVAGHIAPDHDKFRAIVVQTVEPFDCGVFRIPSETMKQGERLVRRNLNRLKDCLVTDFWPGAMPDEQDLVLSRWAAGNEEIEIGEEF